ncbi:MAG: YciI family protein [Gammaproteobacteria bacterium]
MQYMLMCCFDEKRWVNMPETQKDQIMEQYGEVLETLVKSGHYRGGAQLHPIATATTVRKKDGKPVITDGPFAETKEQLGGYHLIDCKDLDEAISIAARIPTLPAGGVIEVRPIEHNVAS